MDVLMFKITITIFIIWSILFPFVIWYKEKERRKPVNRPPIKGEK